MEKIEARNLRSLIWNLRGKYGTKNVRLVFHLNEYFYSICDPQDIDYSTMIENNLFVETPDGSKLLYSVKFESLWGLENDFMSNEYLPYHKECIKLAKYFNDLKYVKVESIADGSVYEEVVYE